MVDSHLVAPRRLWSVNHETGWRVIVDSPIPISAPDPTSGPPWDRIPMRARTPRVRLRVSIMD